MGKNSFKTFEDLDCWKACTRVRRYITDLVKKYPKKEKYGLVSDMKGPPDPLPITLQRGLAGITSRRISNFVVIVEAHYMNLSIN
jgi:hypothetical protein